MRNEASERPFPNNLFYDLGAEAPTEQAEDFFGTFMYVLRVVTDARNSRAMLLRYKEGKSYDEIGDALGVSKQRAQELIQSIVNTISGEYILMLQKGIKRYYDDLFADRIAYLNDTIEESEREQIKQDAYAEGYHNGFIDGLVGKKANTANIDVLSTVSIDTVKLSVRAYNALQKNGIRSLGDLVRVGDKVIGFRTFGKTCFIEIIALLKSYDVNIATTFPKACEKWRVY